MLETSSESLQRRVKRPLPYEFSLPEFMFLRMRLVAKYLPEISQAGVDAVSRALERARNGEPEPEHDPAAIAAAVAASDRRQQMVDEATYGIFLANVFVARSAFASKATKDGAIERLLPSLKPDFRSYKGRLYPAAERRHKKFQPNGRELSVSNLTWADSSSSENDLTWAEKLYVNRKRAEAEMLAAGFDQQRIQTWPVVRPQVPIWPTPQKMLAAAIRTAIAGAVRSADISRDHVSLGGKKFTHTDDGAAIVPTHHLQGPDLRHVLKSTVLKLLEAEFELELRELERHESVESSLEQHLAPRESQTDTGAQWDVDEASDWGDDQPAYDWGASPDQVARLHDKYPGAGETHFGGPLTEALSVRNVLRLDALEAEETISAQRAQKVDELKALGTREQLRLIEAILSTGYTRSSDLAKHLGKRENTVRVALRDLRQLRTKLDPPAWLDHGKWFGLKWDDMPFDNRRHARPVMPYASAGCIDATEEGSGCDHHFNRKTTIADRSSSDGPNGGTIPQSVLCPTAQKLNPWPCNLPTRGFSTSSSAEGFLKPRNGVPA